MEIDDKHRQFFIWLVVSTPLQTISQLGWLFPIYGKIKNVPNHQPDSLFNRSTSLKTEDMTHGWQWQKLLRQFFLRSLSLTWTVVSLTLDTQQHIFLMVCKYLISPSKESNILAALHSQRFKNGRTSPTFSCTELDVFSIFKIFYRLYPINIYQP